MANNTDNKNEKTGLEERFHDRGYFRKDGR